MVHYSEVAFLEDAMDEQYDFLIRHSPTCEILHCSECRRFDELKRVLMQAWEQRDDIRCLTLQQHAERFAAEFEKNG